MSTSAAPSAGPARPYHHGNLRAELLATAEQVLCDEGLEHVTLRELARRAGVSHAAPARHFADRTALFVALAATGFTRLGARVIAAVDGAQGDFAAQFRAVAAEFVRFAVDNSALADVMFTIGKTQRDPELADATAPLYATFGELVDRGLESGQLRPLAADRLRPLIIATLQGVAGLANAVSLDVGRVDKLVDDACALFLA